MLTDDGFQPNRYNPTSKTMSEVGAFQLIKQGNLRVEIHFADALTATINVIMYAEIDNVIEIDRNRQVFLDYSA